MKPGAEVPRLFTMFVTLSLLAVVARTYGQEAGPVTLEQIRARHMERLSATHSVRLLWEEERAMMNGSVIAEVIDGYPEDPQVMTGAGELIISGSSSWMSWLPSRWDAVQQRVRPAELPIIFAFHDGIGREFYPGPDGAGGGIVRENPWASHAQLHLMAMSSIDDPPYLVEPSYAVLGYRTTDAGERVVVGNTDYDDPNLSRVGAIRWEFELDPSRDYVVTRWIMMNPDGRALFEATVTYEEHAVIRYAPVEVTSIFSATGNMDMAQGLDSFRITSYEVNGPVEAGLFEFEFPLGTEVSDDFEGISYIVGEAGAPTEADTYVDNAVARLRSGTRDAAEKPAFRRPAIVPRPDRDPPTRGARYTMAATFPLGIAVVVGFVGAIIVASSRRKRKARLGGMPDSQE